MNTVINAVFSSDDGLTLRATAAHEGFKAKLDYKQSLSASKQIEHRVQEDEAKTSTANLDAAQTTAQNTSNELAAQANGNPHLTISAQIMASLATTAGNVSAQIKAGTNPTKALTQPQNAAPMPPGTPQSHAVSLKVALQFAQTSQNGTLAAGVPHLKLAAELTAKNSKNNGKASITLKWALNVGLSFAASAASGQLKVTGNLKSKPAPKPKPPMTASTMKQNLTKAIQKLTETAKFLEDEMQVLPNHITMHLVNESKRVLARLKDDANAALDPKYFIIAPPTGTKSEYVTALNASLALLTTDALKKKHEQNLLFTLVVTQRLTDPITALNFTRSAIGSLSGGSLNPPKKAAGTSNTTRNNNSRYANGSRLQFAADLKWQGLQIKLKGGL